MPDLSVIVTNPRKGRYAVEIVCGDGSGCHIIEGDDADLAFAARTFLAKAIGKAQAIALGAGEAKKPRRGGEKVRLIAKTRSGFEIQYPEAESTISGTGETERKAKAPRLTRAQKAEIDGCLSDDSSVPSPSDEFIARKVGAEVSQVKRYLAKKANGGGGA